MCRSGRRRRQARTQSRWTLKIYARQITVHSLVSDGHGRGLGRSFEGCGGKGSCAAMSVMHANWAAAATALAMPRFQHIATRARCISFLSPGRMHIASSAIFCIIMRSSYSINYSRLGSCGHCNSTAYDVDSLTGNRTSLASPLGCATVHIIAINNTQLRMY